MVDIAPCTQHHNTLFTLAHTTLIFCDLGHALSYLGGLPKVSLVQFMADWESRTPHFYVCGGGAR